MEWSDARTLGHWNISNGAERRAYEPDTGSSWCSGRCRGTSRSRVPVRGRRRRGGTRRRRRSRSRPPTRRRCRSAPGPSRPTDDFQMSQRQRQREREEYERCGAEETRPGGEEGERVNISRESRRRSATSKISIRSSRWPLRLCALPLAHIS